MMDRFQKQRLRMVDTQIRARGVLNPRILEAMSRIPRHLFVEEALADQAYNDNPLPIGDMQTISQPYIVALMTDALDLKGREKVLEIGYGFRISDRPAGRTGGSGIFHRKDCVTGQQRPSHTRFSWVIIMWRYESGMAPMAGKRNLLLMRFWLQRGT